MEDKISELRYVIELDGDSISELTKRLGELTNNFTSKCNEITELKAKLRQYEKREEIEHFIKTLGRRYIARDTNMTWVSIFSVLYPTADEHEYHKRGKAKQAIIDLLRSQDLGFNEDGTIFRSL
jgi:hypothetical protein